MGKTKKGRGMRDEGFYFIATKRLKMTERNMKQDDLGALPL